MPPHTTHSPRLTLHQSQFRAWQLTRHAAGNSVEALATSLVDAQIDLNPHQVEAALFAVHNPLSKGVILADEVGLGKTIEAGLVISQHWAERKRHILIIVPANLRKQWHQELQDKFGLQSVILEATSFKDMARRNPQRPPFDHTAGPVICSYQFTKSRARDIQRVGWDLVVMDEAHRLRNVYKTRNVIAKALQDALAHVPAKVLLTATPLQNSLLELYGLVSMIDDKVFGSVESFRAQFGGSPGEAELARLRQRLAPLCKRTLRRDVQPYVAYTARRAMVEHFTPSAQEKELSTLVADYLARPNLKALPDGQRHLISLVLWKLLASSTHAIAGALDTMARRLQSVIDGEAGADTLTDLVDQFDQDMEGLAAQAEEAGAEDDAPLDETTTTPPRGRDAVLEEIRELQHFRDLAQGIRDNAKGTALLTALERAFAELEALGAPRKAILFTESRRTQDYLLSLLKDTPWAGPDGDGVVLFNGTNSDAQAQSIHRRWLARHADTDRVTGSRTADTRAALVEHFRDHASVMIATEAGAEGINLQFCSLVINYDLPWNPQRIEQRIGRCHRYGQKFDVVVVNFVDRSNEADARVYELLNEKFHLFDGVFGASDEVLGAIGSGVDFERRIAGIYQTCRSPEAIRTGFDALRRELSGEIDEAMVRTRRTLLEHFDEQVQARLKLHADDSRTVRQRHEQWLLDVTRAEVGDCAVFAEDRSTTDPIWPTDRVFELIRPPAGSERHGEVPVGGYELPRRSGEAHLYRLEHPLAQWALAQAKAHVLPVARLVFDYAAHGVQVATLKGLRGQAGWLTTRLCRVEALGQVEEHLIVAACTAQGALLPEDDPEKLLRLPAVTADIADIAETPSQMAAATWLEPDIEQRTAAVLAQVNARNLGLFDQEVTKLDAWAEDLKLGLEQTIDDLDAEIRDTRRASTVAAALQDKLARQKQVRDLESRRTRLKRELFDRHDEIEAQRNGLIEQLEAQLQQTVEHVTLFTVEWHME